RSVDFYLELDKVERDDVPPMRLTHQVTGPGSYIASADLPSEGRWRLRMVFEEITGVFEFESDG
ncbi:AAA family ATPase, partial [Azoarcus taiwanensis]|nr:AAA family ATPase [Azoarcus taiwanensis]